MCYTLSLSVLQHVLSLSREQICARLGLSTCCRTTYVNYSIGIGIISSVLTVWTSIWQPSANSATTHESLAKSVNTLTANSGGSVGFAASNLYAWLVSRFHPVAKERVAIGVEPALLSSSMSSSFSSSSDSSSCSSSMRSESSKPVSGASWWRFIGAGSVRGFWSSNPSVRA